MNTNESDIIVKSPGRINLIVEHIDYNGGHVLPAAIDRKVTMWFRKKDNSLCRVNSEDEGAFTFDINKPLQISLFERIECDNDNKRISMNYFTIFNC